MRRITALFTLTVILFGILPAAQAAGSYRADINNDYVFSVYGEDGTYTLLGGDSQTGYFVIANSFYGTKEFSTSKAPKTGFSFTDTNSIGYWLNNDFTKSDNSLSESILKYIDYSHEWTEGRGGVSLLSAQELDTYAERIGFNADFGKTAVSDYNLNENKYWWLRDTADDNAGKSKVCSGVQSEALRQASLTKTSKALVRPVFYLKADFFKNIRLNLFCIGKAVKKTVKDTDMASIDYNEVERSVLEEYDNNSIIGFEANILPDDRYITSEPHFDINVTADTTVKDNYIIKISGTKTKNSDISFGFSNNKNQSFKRYLDCNDGVQTFKVSLYNGESFIKSIEETVIVLPDNPNEGNRLSGYNTHISYSFYDVDTTVALLDYMGATVVRDHGLWSTVEQEKNKYIWTDKFISYVNKLEACGIEMIYILTANNELYGDSWNGKLDTDEEINGFINYALATAKQFPQIKRFEILNEANNSYTPEEYYKVTAAVSRALKEYDPSIQITTGAIGGELPNPVSPWKDFAAAFVDKDTFAYADALSFHSYCSGNYADSAEYKDNIKVLKNALRTFGGWKDLQITETGYGTGMFWYDNQETFNEAVQIEVQANETVKRSVVNDSLGIALTTNFVLLEEISKDVQQPPKWGIVSDDGIPKKAYCSVKNFYCKTNNAVFMGEVSVQEGVSAYWYRCNGENIVIMWQDTDTPTQRTSVKNKAEVNVSFDDAVTVEDIYGNEKDPCKNLSVTTDVLYINGLSDEYLQKAYKETALKRISEETSYLNNTSVDAYCAVYPELCAKPEFENIMLLLNNLHECGMDMIKNEVSNNKTYLEISAELSELYNICDEVSKLLLLCDVQKADDISAIKAVYESFEKTISGIGAQSIIYKDEPYKKGKKLICDIEKCSDISYKKVSTEHAQISKNGKITVSGECAPNTDVTIKICNDGGIQYIGYVTSDEEGKYLQEISLKYTGDYRLTLNDGTNNGTAYNETFEYYTADDNMPSYAKAVLARSLLLWSQSLMKNELKGGKYLHLDDFTISKSNNTAEISFMYNNSLAEEETPIMIAAAYSNGALTDYKPIRPEKGESKYSCNLQYSDNDLEIKIMLFNSFENIIPLKDYFLIKY